MDLVSVANLIPGPNSIELVIHIGLQRAGYAGMLVAGLCFIAPAMFSVLAQAAAYVRFGSLPAALAMLADVQPVVVAVVAHALLGLGRAALRRWQALLIAGGVLLLALAGVNEVGLLRCCCQRWLQPVRCPLRCRCCAAAAMCCCCFCGRTWWCGWAGSRSASCWMPWLPAS